MTNLHTNGTEKSPISILILDVGCYPASLQSQSIHMSRGDMCHIKCQSLHCPSFGDNTEKEINFGPFMVDSGLEIRQLVGQLSCLSSSTWVRIKGDVWGP